MALFGTDKKPSSTVRTDHRGRGYRFSKGHRWPNIPPLRIRREPVLGGARTLASPCVGSDGVSVEFAVRISAQRQLLFIRETTFDETRSGILPDFFQADVAFARDSVFCASTGMLEQNRVACRIDTI